MERKKYIKISLEKNEARIAAVTGTERRLESMFKGYHRDTVGIPKFKIKSWDYEIQGAAAELAVCKSRLLYWPCGVNTFKNADIGKKLQVRHTDTENGRLILRPGDNKDHTYILVIGRIPDFELVGWMKGEDAIKEEYKDNPNGGKMCWMVPQHKLIGFKGVREVN